MLCSTLFCAVAAHAAADPDRLTMTANGITRTLVTNHWSTDHRGIPAFDYEFKLSGPGCAYQRRGHAVAGFDDAGDGIELETYPAQDAKGREGTPVTMFYDSTHHDVFFQVALDGKKRIHWLSLRDGLVPKATTAACGLREKAPVAMFTLQ
jgi:hypothetical protein